MAPTSLFAFCRLMSPLPIIWIAQYLLSGMAFSICGQMYKPSTIILIVGYSYCFMDLSDPLPTWHPAKRFPTTFTYSSSARKKSALLGTPWFLPLSFSLLCPCPIFHKWWPLADNVDIICGDYLLYFIHFFFLHKSCSLADNVDIHGNYYCTLS